MTALALTVIGGGEHARVVIETARSQPGTWHVEGFADPAPCEETCRRLAVTRLGDDVEVLGRPGERRYVLGVGSVGVGRVRRAIADRYASAGAGFGAIVHSRAWVSPTAIVEEGAVILAGAIVQSGSRIGTHAVVGSGTIVEHDVELGAFVQTGPGVVIGGGAIVGADTYLGLGACVRDHVTIGASVVVAMGAAVVADVARGAAVYGVPARPRTP